MTVVSACGRCKGKCKTDVVPKNKSVIVQVWHTHTAAEKCCPLFPSSRAPAQTDTQTHTDTHKHTRTHRHTAPLRFFCSVWESAQRTSLAPVCLGGGEGRARLWTADTRRRNEKRSFSSVHAISCTHARSQSHAHTQTCSHSCTCATAQHVFAYKAVIAGVHGVWCGHERIRWRAGDLQSRPELRLIRLLGLLVFSLSHVHGDVVFVVVVLVAEGVVGVVRR